MIATHGDTLLAAVGRGIGRRVDAERMTLGVRGGLGVALREPRFAGPVPISVRAHLATSDLRVENILSEGVLDLTGGRPGYRGTVTAGPGALGTLPFEKLAGDIVVNPPLVTLERGNVRLLG